MRCLSAFISLISLLTLPLLAGEPMPDQLRSLERIAVYPPLVQLFGRDDHRQLVITGWLSDKQPVDLTRTARVVVDPPGVVEVTGSLDVLPRASGRAVIRVEVAGQTVQARVEVRDGETPRPLNFTNDVAPLLTRLGCNSGSCHGKSTGRGGFRLSLFGHHPEWDHEWITQGARGRRVFTAAPGASLLLRKPTMQVPHGGGRRLRLDSPEYALLLRWIASGTSWSNGHAPQLERLELFPPIVTLSTGRRQQLSVTAFYSDGSSRDVTRVVELRSNDATLIEVNEAGVARALERTGETAVIALLQGQAAVSRVAVPLENPQAKWPSFPVANFIDGHVERKLQGLRVAPSPLCDDATFLRRVTLHLAGRVPRIGEVEEFLGDRRPQKRKRLVRRLLHSADYADFFALKWSDLLRNKRRGQKDRAPGTITFHRWIRNAVARGMPYDRFVRAILTATGNVSVSPPAQWYAEVRYLDRYVDDTAQVFLGLRIGCARCHHHPFEDITQEDYYGLAAFFARLDRQGGVGVAERKSNETVFVKASGQVKHPLTGRVVLPHGLGGPVVEVPPYADPRHQLVDWMAAPDNPYFARAFVNRMWAHCFGRGLVEPIDDLRVTNPASNPPLLDALARDFVKSGFDMRHVLETLTTSTTYQLATTANADNLDETQAHSRFYPKRLTAEVLLDAVDVVTDRKTGFGGLPTGTRAVQLPDEGYSNTFLKLFGRPPRESACECERSSSPSLSQSLFVLNDAFLLGKVFHAEGRAAQLAGAPGDHSQRVRRLFLLALSRPATQQEVEKAVKYIVSEADAKTAYGNLLWALINTKEFLYNH